MINADAILKMHLQTKPHQNFVTPAEITNNLSNRRRCSFDQRRRRQNFFFLGHLRVLKNVDDIDITQSSEFSLA